MRHWLVAAFVGWSSLASAVAEDGDSSRPEDRKAIAALTSEFVAAFDKGDSQALGKLFLADARAVDDEGQVAQGRDAVVQRFAAGFAARPGGKIKIMPSTLDFLGQDAAIETGTATVTSADGLAPETSSYSVLYLRQDGRWLHANVEDRPAPAPSPKEQMKTLEPLVGEWLSESSSAVVHYHYRWNQSHASLIADFEVKIGGKIIATGTERIGWDPLTKRFRSWVFESQGGWSEGLWSRAGADEWVVKTTGVRSDGELATATRHMRWAGKDRIAIQVRDRTFGDAVAADVVFTMVKRPPKPH